MEVLKIWFTAITGVIVLSALGEGLLPSGNVKKYVRLLFGLILVITVCTPFAVSKKTDFKIISQGNTPYIETEKVDEKEREAVLRLYRANLSKQIISSLELIDESCKFSVQVDVETRNMDEFGTIRGVTVTVKQKDKELYINDEIEEIIAESYKVPKKNIAIKYVEAE